MSEDRQRLTFVEIDIPVCSLTYGVAPCTATLGGPDPTGTRKCFNSIKTCQDRANFTESTVTLRFAEPADYLVESGIDAIPSITGINFSPAIISLGENLGVRASLDVTFGDHKWPDTGEGYDRYVAERPYDPYRLGTYWGKFRARQPFLRGRAIRLIRGWLGQSLGEMDTRHYVIESTDGPGSEGAFRVSAKDILKLADGDRSQAPRVSNGFLVGAIDADDMSATLTPAGIGNAEYPAAGIAAIGGKEIVRFTRVGDVLTFTARHAFGTAAVPHDAQDRVQLCLYYEAEDPADINADLLENYTPIGDMSGSVIPIDAWRAETGAYLRRVYTTLIADPTGVNKLVSELIEQAALAIWWRDREREIDLQVLRQISTDAAVWDQGNIIEGSFDVRDQPNKRISQVWVYFGMINPLGKVDDPSNYRSCEVTVNDDAEADNGSPAIKKIFSRWIPAFGRSVAARLGAIQLGRYSTAPRRFNFDGFVDEDPQLGTGYQITGGEMYTPMQDDTGANEIVPMQITSHEPRSDRHKLEAEEVRFITLDEEDLSNRVIIIDGNAFNLNLRAVHDTLYPSIGEGDTVTFIINAGVIVGSTSTLEPAVILGDWPVGFTPKLVLNGRIQGMGGVGAGYSGLSGSQPAGDGGLALYLRHALDVEYGPAAQLWSGGGGGGSNNKDRVNSGGGGAGYLPGAAGLAEGGDEGPGIAGTPGTTETGGTGGGTSSTAGGDGGGPGLDGEDGGLQPGGVAGDAIDGVSFINVISGVADVRGATIN